MIIISQAGETIPFTMSLFTSIFTFAAKKTGGKFRQVVTSYLSDIFYFRNKTNPRLSDLAMEMIFELELRNGEARGLRFDDFSLDEGWVHIQGTAEVGKRHRNERVKKDSESGNRYLSISNRVKKIYWKAKELSWSDEYLFVCDPWDVKGDEILISECSVGRALKRACEAIEIRYLKPHEVRASNAAQMVLDGMDVYEIKKALGHSDIKTTERYIGNITKRAPAKGVDNEKILEEYGSRHVDRHVKSEIK